MNIFLMQRARHGTSERRSLARLTVPWLTMALALIACDAAAPPDRGYSATDSAGVWVATNEHPVWAPGEGWTVDPEPVLSIGRVDGSEPYLLDRVMGAVLLPDGRVAVADMGSGQLRFYDDHGRHTTSAGGIGDGPEEFRQVMGLYLTPGDRLAVDDRLERVHHFDLGGRHAGSFRRGTYPLPSVAPWSLQEDPLPVRWIVGWFDDRTMVVREDSALDPDEVRDPQAQGPWTVTSALLALDAGADTGKDSAEAPATGEPRPFLTIPGPTWHRAPMGVVLREVFGTRTLAAADPLGLVTVHSPTGEIREYDASGTLQARTLHPVPSRPVTPEMVDMYVSLSSPPVAEEIARGRAFADTLPAYGRVLLDRDGRIWLQEYLPAHGATTSDYVMTVDAPSRWQVFARAGSGAHGGDASGTGTSRPATPGIDAPGTDALQADTPDALPPGRWLGAVDLPPGFTLLDVSGDRVLGLARDPLGVEYVRVRRLRTPAAG